MRIIQKVILVVFAAMLVLSLGAGAASANRSLEASETIITLLSNALSLQGPINIICRVGITVTLTRRTFSKRAQTIGRAELRVLDAGNRCTNGRAFVVAGTYGVNYLSFTGTLPNIAGLNLELLGVSFLIESLGTSCLYVVDSSLGLQRVNTTTHRIEALEGNPFRLTGVRLTTILEQVFVRCPRTEAEIGLAGIFSPEARTATLRLL